MVAKTTGPYSGKDEQKLMVELWSTAIKDNPYNFVMFTFPWGKKGTPLENFKGPKTWQKKILLDIAKHIQKNKELVKKGEIPESVQIAVSSGRGIGKSTLVAWLNLWMMSCILGSTSINAANTESQLKDKTWSEVGKWHGMAINSHWFEKTALSLRPSPWLENALQKQLKLDSGYYYAIAQTWDEKNPDAFAGAHNMNGILLIFDEASGIPKSIWTVCEGFFTEPTIYRFWLVFSNPRRNTGAFFECFHLMRNYWKGYHIDSRDVEGTDKKKLEEILIKYGEDSDTARIEVKGQFPNQSNCQFISRSIVQEAQDRELEEDSYAALYMGVDIARFGDDKTVIRFRQGRNARVIEPVTLEGADNMKVANVIADLILRYKPDAVCIDAGNGTGVIDRLRERKFKIYEVWFGSKSDKEEYADKRTELWASMREWLNGGCIDRDSELAEDLAGPEYHFVGSGDKIRLEAKEHMKDRGLASPDHGDALACTFFVKVARKDSHMLKNKRKTRIAKDIDYNVLD